MLIHIITYDETDAAITTPAIAANGDDAAAATITQNVADELGGFDASGGGRN